MATGDNDFEIRFGRFLQGAGDVTAFTKLPSQFGFAIDNTDPVSNLRYYQPDWVVVLTDGTRYLAEIKGREDVDVARKDRAAQIWCEIAPLLTEIEWRYLKVPEKDFVKLQPTVFADLQALYAPTLIPALPA